MLRAPFVSFWQSQGEIRQAVYFGPSPHCAQWGAPADPKDSGEILWTLGSFSAFFVNFGAKLGDSFSETLTTCGGFAENCLTTEAYDFLGLFGIF